MNVKCPACGAVNSLDSLVGNEAASKAIYAALKLNGELGTALISYLGLFRPAKRALSYERVTHLLNELNPLILAGEIQRDGKYYPAPVEAWIYGINAVLTQRHSLDLPMKSHGYLFEVISRWKGALISPPVLNQGGIDGSANHSKTVGAIQAAVEWANQ